jgi:serine/threonine-protein kinase
MSSTRRAVEVDGATVDEGFGATVDGGFGATIDAGLGATIDAGGVSGALLQADPNRTVALPLEAQGVSRGVTGAGVGRPVGVTAPALDGKATISGFSTMLPKVSGQQLITDPRPRFEILQALGQGGMGEVNLVQDHEIGRTVAVKRLLNASVDPAGVARFVDEVRTTGYLEHPNIVPIYDAGVDDQGRCFFIMKRLAGETLEGVIERLRAGDAEMHRRFPFHVRAQVVLGLLNALQFAHAQGVVHRDIKPANVMVGPYGEVVLMDWGVAKPMKAKEGEAPAAQGKGAALGDAPEDHEVITQPSAVRQRLFETRHGALVGTPAYMSPEQAQGLIDQTDERSDLYSVGVLFLELLTLKHYLHDKRSVMEMLTGIMMVSPVPHALDHSAEVQEKPPIELLHVAIKAMGKAPAERYQSAAEMIEALQRAISGRINVECGMTFTKRGLHEVSKLLERNQLLLMPMHLVHVMMPRDLMNKNPKLIAPMMLCLMLLPVALIGLTLGLLIG